MKRNYIILGAIVTLLVVGGVVLTRDRSAKPIGGSGLPEYEGDFINNIGNDSFLEQLTSDQLKQKKEKLKELEKTLQNDPNDREAWLEVGIIKKFFNNHQGAADAWEYGKNTIPILSTFYYNLGGLYGYELQMPEKAEENYLKAIEIDPTLEYLYTGLAEFYAVSNPSRGKDAITVIKEGLKSILESESLTYLLEYYEREFGE
ncbi:MAG: hypothetical protein COU08_01815 [Candidatus Harrisonbacteria bacterium CG10_big_fil_rev_8_21_14_0_10_42_17]|uniref:Uncharacterized protein n=1 Tax=Candidatus Harrisonbacteria bacterium CG10_big_fil_rev_8_21_14_0_10_42_17 TaxID=1974584 RepID=A0A2M6WID4_9BACT|nr:MAG: hypothetical protein COU08_01815 [Candidatus Harrisonbacteria bacterium CG10_big_fil_rev_8_21_14_0_10_42_17]